ncbi:MAG: aminoacyl-tRNA hydrolase [Anaerotardibacter sp.]
MVLIVGLGNPGDEYAHTRHNAGFDTIDLLAEELRVNYWKNTGGALVGEGKLTLPDGEVTEVILAKPQSYMNLSGGPVQNLVKAYKVNPEDVIVVHDELDIPPATIKVKKGGGHAGHNGLKSIIAKCGTREFLRVRVGIGRPPGRMPVPDYVLSCPRKNDKDDFEEAVHKASLACLSLIKNGLAKTQSEFNS